MKKIKLLLAALPILLAACDEVSTSDRFIELPAVPVARNVLLEEFTGQTCTNCPDAHRVIESLEHQYGDALIVVSIHAGYFGIPAEWGGLMQEEGDQYANRWGIDTYPAGVVDRTGSKMKYEDFSSAIKNEIGKQTTLEMTLEAELSDDGKSINVFTTLLSPEDLNGNLQLWVVENGIVAEQLDNGKVILDYVHNNVFRGCINGLWGETVNMQKNIAYYPTGSIAVNPEWNLDNIRIVGFYYNDSQGVIQVERCAIGETVTDEPEAEE